jgi:ELWxxDGT repeat protein
MSAKTWRLAGVALACLGLIPRLAAGQGSIGPAQDLQIPQGFRGSGVTSMIRAGGLAFFTVQGTYVSESLWRSDGTGPGTFALAVTGSPAALSQAGLRFWTVQGSRVFFTKPLDAAAHRDLWRSDGTVEGTVPLTQGLSLAIDASAGEPPTSLAVPESGLVFFSAGAESAQPDYELWATDGTAEGTRLVKDVNPAGPSNPGHMAALGGQLFFLVEAPQGRELWRSDGTPEGTERVESLPQLDGGKVVLARAGDALFLLAETATGVRLWRNDGRWTSDLLDFPAFRLLGHAAAGRHFFVAIGDEGSEDKLLFAASGDLGDPGIPVQVLKTSSPGTFDLFAFGDGVLFALSETGTGLEPWLSDGTAEGTRRIADLCPGPCDFPLLRGEELNGWLVLLTEKEVWLSDGTGGGTFRAAEYPSAYDVKFLTLPNRILIATWTLVPALGFPVGQLWSLPVTAPAPPPGGWLESPRVPGFRFKVRIDGQTPGRLEPSCMARTLCVSGALPGRSEVFVRWPSLVKLMTAAVEVWALQTATDHLRHYRLEATDPAGSTLEGLLDRNGFQDLTGALESSVAEAKTPKAPKPPQPPGRWIESKTVPGFRVQARLTMGGKSQLLRREPCIAETFCLSGAVPGQAELLVRVTGPRPNGYYWPMLARFTPAALEVWIEQRKTGKVRYYRLNSPASGSAALDGLVDRQGFKR